MRPLVGEQLLRTWEIGESSGYFDRTLAMLKAACPETPVEDLRDVSISEINLQLLQLRQSTFGSSLTGFLPCQSCSSRLEFTFPISRMLERLEALASAPSVQWKLGENDYSLRTARLSDVQLANAQDGMEQARTLLLDRCLTLNSATHTPTTLSNAERDLALTKLNEMHATVEVDLSVSCPICGLDQSVDLDIARFLWTEIRHAALALLRQVHELAGTYGWDEKAILNMSQRRRSTYLEMIHS